ncbi:acyltransferase [Alteribacter keqinensis]|uniref:Acyltransferase n=1 Tax=Alteribacter keqinensis TaxID=2483800 RepID=A0A3M7TR45_9BACI|nr:acyltransferase [Alteribacter keqinensis]RNA67737.1 acyltransferase [Alteribacter keqinensis]
MRGRDKFKRFKPMINFLVTIYSIFPYQIRVKLFEHYRMVKGTKGLVLRYVLLKSIAKNCGDNISIHPNVYLLNPRNFSVGNNVSIHPMCYIESFGGIEIGNDVSIAHGVTIMSTGHHFASLDTTINNQGGFIDRIVIDDDVWIGAKATILAGNKISTGSVVGAGAVVSKEVQAYTVVGGVPAKVIKERK